MVKIMEQLCLSAYRNMNDDNTRVYIINSITKLHIALNFIDNQKVAAVMVDFLSSRHVDV
jgi:hypothetical protein